MPTITVPMTYVSNVSGTPLTNPTNIDGVPDGVFATQNFPGTTRSLLALPPLPEIDPGATINSIAAYLSAFQTGGGTGDFYLQSLTATLITSAGIFVTATANANNPYPIASGVANPFLTVEALRAGQQLWLDSAKTSAGSVSLDGLGLTINYTNPPSSLLGAMMQQDEV